MLEVVQESLSETVLSLLGMPGLERRSSALEFMDDLDFQGADLIESFRFIRMVNLLGGGQRAVLNGLRTALKKWPRHRPVEILDVGCGIGDLGIAMTRWGRQHDFEIRYRGLDQSDHTLALARQHTRSFDFEFVRGDLFSSCLPEADLVVASMVLHHFNDEDVVRAIRNLGGKARHALIINDLERSPLAWLAAWFLTAPLSRLSRADALTSVEKGFTVDELATLCHRADVHGTVRQALGWRVLMVGGKRPI